MKKILGILGAVALLGLVAFLFSDNSEYKTKRVLYSVGAISEETGEVVKNDGALYTKNAFECKGLKIDLDNDSDISYQIFFYNEDDEFVSASDVFNADHKFEVEDGLKARVVIYPNWEEYADINQEVTILNRLSFTKQIEIRVLKEQPLKKTTTTEKAE